MLMYRKQKAWVLPRKISASRFRKGVLNLDRYGILGLMRRTRIYYPKRKGFSLFLFSTVVFILLMFILSMKGVIL